MFLEKVDDIEKRTLRDEWYYLADKYPAVAFNYRNGSEIHLKENGFKHLLAAEPYIEVPEHYDAEIVRKYESYITWNTVYYEKFKNITKTYLIKGCPACNQYFYLNEFIPYKDKIKGIVVLNKINETGREGDIYFQRKKVMDEIPFNKEMIKHVWCRDPWGGSMYQGNIPYYHSHFENLKKINQYLFCLCFESTFHSIWSRDFITERMFNCFKSKTVPVYLGCWNIEDYVPKELFVDYRDFNYNNISLANYLMSIKEEQYTEMVEKAFLWNKNNRIGSIFDLEVLLQTLK